MLSKSKIQKLLQSVEKQLNLLFFVKNAYNGQRRKSGELAYQHPFRMYGEAYKIGIRDEVILIGMLLHDVLEDTDVSYEELRLIFGKEFGFVVDSLSIIDKDKKSISKKQYFDEFERDVRVEPKIMIIKMFDCIDNLETLGYLSKKKQEKFIEEKKNFYLKVFSENYGLVPEEFKGIFLCKLKVMKSLLSS